MPAYEAGDFDPPAPVAHASIGGPSGLVLSDIPLLIDTGADYTVVSRWAAERVGAMLRPSDIRVRLYEGTQARCYTAELTVAFLRFRFKGPFLIADSEFGLIGRNVLNVLVCTFDGPRQSWSASGPTAPSPSR